MNSLQAGIFIKRLVAFALLWWLLTGGDLSNWPLGALVVVVSALISTAMAPPGAWSLIGLAGFVPFFLWHSLKGGFDVALRTFRRSLPLNPQVVTYPVGLPLEQARLFFANTINLLPGTLCTEYDDDQLHVHVLDGQGNFRHELEALERRVALLYKLSLSSNRGEPNARL